MPARHDRPERVRQSPGTPAGPESRLHKSQPAIRRPCEIFAPTARRAPRGVHCPVRGIGRWSDATSAAPTGELDAFMQKVLARRDFNRQTLNSTSWTRPKSSKYRSGTFAAAPEQTRVHVVRSRRDHVRSPLRFNGVGIGEEARLRYEERWLERERRAELRPAPRKERKDSAMSSRRKAFRSIDPAVRWSHASCPSRTSWTSSSIRATTTSPAARQLEGKEVLKIEYYPTRMFSDDDEEDLDRTGRSRQSSQRSAASAKPGPRKRGTSSAG